MRLVDSKKKKMSLQEVLMTTYRDNMLSTKKDGAKVAGIVLMKEFSEPNASLEQLGNTVFGGHRGAGESDNLMYGRVFNRDTVDNFAENYVKHLVGLGKQGVTGYVADFKDPLIVKTLPKVAKKLKAKQIRTHTIQEEDKFRFVVEVA